MSASFTRGTTPDYRFTVAQDLSDWEVYLSFGQNGHELVRIEDPTITPANGGCKITGRLTQEQTLRFREGKGEAQVRAYKNGAAAANPAKFEFTVYGVIMGGTIPKGEQ